MKNAISNLGNKISTKLKSIIFSAQGFPIVLTLSTLCLLFVLFRMKTVELDYKIAAKNRTIDKSLSNSKELSALKANLLSVKNLRSMANKHGLKEPNQQQVIVIP